MRVPAARAQYAYLTEAGTPASARTPNRSEWCTTAVCGAFSDVTSDIFLPGSESPASLLYTAYENFEVRAKDT